MPKIRKQKKRKSFNTSINRKRLRNRIEKVGNIECIPIKKAWNQSISIRSNLKEMGLAYDANEVLKIPSYKELEKQKALEIANDESGSDEEAEQVLTRPPKKEIVSKLESEARAPRENTLRLPRAQVDFVTYLMDKYGTDYKAMAKDSKNYYQETWKQIRAKIKKFMSTPKEYSKYLAEKGLLNDTVNDDDVKMQAEALCEDSD